MNDWTEGYVSDHTYANYYFHQLAPDFLRLLCLLSGKELPPREEGEPLRYLELGYGRGLSLNIHAAADQEAEYWGTDFLPEQAVGAEELSTLAGTHVRMLNNSFAELDELAQAGKLPGFDIIVMHGIWSWINDENRRHILNIIHAALRPGGIVYVSYNALPGRSASMPIRELMAIHAERKGAEKDSVTQAKDALLFMQTLQKAGAAFFSDNLNLASFVGSLSEKSPVYLAHEYLNRSWHPFFFSEVAKDMASAGCSFITSTNRPSLLDMVQPEGTLPFLNGAPDPVIRETIRDFNLNQGFRTDVFIKGGRCLAADEYEIRLDREYFAVRTPLEQVKELTVPFPVSTGTLDMDIYFPILEALAENHYEPKSLEYLRKHPRLADIEYRQLLFYLNMLLQTPYIFPARPAPSEKSVSACNRFNRILCERAVSGEENNYLVSPVLGSGLFVSRYYQLFLLFHASGKKDPKGWARDASAIYSRSGKSLSARTPKGTRTGLEAFEYEARLFEKIILPWLKAMKVALSPPSGKA